MGKTEHQAILEIKDIMQVFEPADNEDVETQFYGNMTIDEILETLKEFNVLVGEIKQILREVKDENIN